MTDQSEPKGKGRRGAHFTEEFQRYAQIQRTRKNAIAVSSDEILNAK